MSSTLLEQTRAAHEELERLQRTIIDEMKRAPKTHKDNVIQSHNINNALDRIVDASRRLERIYEDKDGSRKEEITSIGGTGPSLYSLFYDRLREIKDYHRRYPNVQAERPEDLHLPEPQISFTGEEGHGKYLDLHASYLKFINLDAVKRVDYVTYVQNFYKFDQFSESRFYSSKHKEYVTELLDYLVSFLARTQPLLILDTELQPHVKEFEEKWNSGAFNNAPAASSTETNANSSTNNNNNNNNNSTNNDNNNNAPTTTTTPAAQPAGDAANADKKKKKKRKPKKDNKDKKDESITAAPATPAATQDNFNNPLYCRACGKLYSKESVFRGHMSGKGHAAAEAAATQQKKDILLKELKVEKIGELLSEQISNTKAYVEKKQSLSTEERLAELEEEESGPAGEEEEEEEEEPVRMTIENYPIGWDGKPIPYWLYKLHGLGIEYKCEICGNTSYFGRKAFEKHFQEWRHAHGMSCLNIPNTLHFQEITKIQDAQALWAKIKVDSSKGQWRPEAEEEYEDADGHVMSRRTFEDLKRQGLV